MIAAFFATQHDYLEDTAAQHQYPGSPYRLAGSSAGSFYCELSDFTDDFILRADDVLAPAVDQFSAFAANKALEKPRSRNEYLLEPLIAGILWNEYEPYAGSAGLIPLGVLSLIRPLRKIHPGVKTFCDAIKGRIIPRILTAGKGADSPSLYAFRRLVLWLNASGEFSEEAQRLSHWVSFLETVPASVRQRYICSWITLASEFKAEAGKRLGRYTLNVDTFIRGVPERNRNRENRIFCARGEAEYHMNMFAAEVMNREFRKDFSAKKNKVVLLPSCMRTPSGGGCRAVQQGKGMKCVGCSPSCEVGNLTKKLAAHDVATSVIPHSSGFSRYLSQWADSKDTALVGVACVLNLLTGGYEMRKLGIASQCVFLDYSGCAKHWSGRGIATSLSGSQLFHILGLGVYHE